MIAADNGGARSVNIFAMVTTRHSTPYTGYALSSLIEHTNLRSEDQVLLIDNDHSYGDLPEELRSRVEVRVNPQPLSFAANINQTMQLAEPQRADLVFLNNDIVFSPGWFEPLRAPGPFLTSPLSNAERSYSQGKFECKTDMDLGEYLGNEKHFLSIVRRHRKSYSGYLRAPFFAFFAVKIPYELYSAVGRLDETFGIGGGEDKDYAIRCYQHGFELRYALASYVLHFQGKSTWRGAETAGQTAARDRTYTERFRQKWGQALFDVFVSGDLNSVPLDARTAYDKGDYGAFILKMGKGIL